MQRHTTFTPRRVELDEPRTSIVHVSIEILYLKIVNHRISQSEHLCWFERYVLSVYSSLRVSVCEVVGESLDIESYSIHTYMYYEFTFIEEI